jgi:predicted metalloprotease with PDZ domain
MIYTLSYSQASSHYIDIKVEAETKGSDKLQFQLPAWRPGRYQLGNFAKNIQRWKAFDQDGMLLKSAKLTKDLWEVECSGVQKVIIEYNYFAFELNAGSTYLDEEQLYVNPVNCLLYKPDKMDEACEFKLELPTDYKVAIALPEIAKNTFSATDFDQLADSPFIASANLQHHQYEAKETTFHLWFQGLFKPDWELLEKDFKAFSEEQINFFGDFPTKEYHFLFQVLTSRFYHGVEHAASTVIAIGPSYGVLDKQDRYEDLLGVSSHELFHTWNVKRIRPIEMWPYDFAKENYSKLGYLAEGATTWYGDVMLYRSKVFSDAQFFRTFNQLLDRHYTNMGVENLSVADSSFDTWLDGYELGAPNRKSSIYTEGALVTFILDVQIRKATDHHKSFDDVMKSFYENYFKAGKGISEADYKKEVEKQAGNDMSEFFESFVNGTDDISTQLEESMHFMGLEIDRQPSDLFHEAHLGVKLDPENLVLMVYPKSVADRAGVSVKDEIVSINGIKLNNDLSNWCQYFKEDEAVVLGVNNSQGFYREVKCALSEDIYFAKHQVKRLESLSKEQERAWTEWLLTK